MPAEDKTLVMIVDDEPIDIQTMRRVLESTGKYRVVSAADYNEAVRTFEAGNQAIDLALIDIALPGSNGVELAKKLLALKPGMHILFVSGHVGASVIRFYGMDAGDEHFLQKPFDSATLQEKVRQTMASTRPLHLILAAASGGSRDPEPPESKGGGAKS
jgi:CheY-like chemotaxis protein